MRPQSEWRPGITPEHIVAELDRTVRIPGLTNVWVPPIRNRIDMLATGVKSPIGVKLSGANLASLDTAARTVEQLAKSVPSVLSAVAERTASGRYLDINIDRVAASRLGLNLADVQEIVSGAIGGEVISEFVEGRARYPISLRYPRELRDTPEKLAQLPIVTDSGLLLTLGDVARVSVADGPAMIRSENGRLAAFVYVDVRGRDIASVVRDLQGVVAKAQLPAGVTASFEYLARAALRLAVIGPVTLAIVFLLLFLTFRRFDEALIVMASVPFALIGGVWLVYLLGYDLSVAVGVGFIALAGLLPILFTGGAGGEVMRRIAAPLVGGMITAPLLSLFVIPAAYLMIRRRGRAHTARRDSLIALPGD